MNEQKFCQESKLTKGVVGRHGGLRAFKTNETTADIGFLDHGHIVGA